MLNASVGVQRALARLRPATSLPTTKASTIKRHTATAAQTLRALVVRPDDGARARISRAGMPRRSPAAVRDMASRLHDPSPMPTVSSTRGGRLSVRQMSTGTQPRPRLMARSGVAETRPLIPGRALPRRSLLARLGPDRAVPAAVIAIVFAAAAISSAPPVGATGPVGGPTGDGQEARIAAGAGAGGFDDTPQDGAVDGAISGDIADSAVGETSGEGPDDYTAYGGGSLPEEASGASGATEADTNSVARDAGFLDDGTILKPIAVDTTVSDGKGLMRTYRVRNGDTLTGIARKFGVSMMTVWWANHLRAKDDLHVGQFLTIPPVSGVVVTVTANDTLETLAAKYGVEPSEIVETNELDDPHLVIGQTLTVPGALGKEIKAPKPKPASKASSGGSRSGGTSKPPSRYNGGKFAWPVAGGYISQYYHYGHYAIDIAADRGTAVKAAAAGTVTFAGWKNNGGGYQIWVSHGSGLYTTYNHLSSISVGRGQHVSRSQQIGRVGASGNATGPHLHFEVWKGPIWNGGTRVNPLAYL